MDRVYSIGRGRREYWPKDARCQHSLNTGQPNEKVYSILSCTLELLLLAEDSYC